MAKSQSIIYNLLFLICNSFHKLPFKLSMALRFFEIFHTSEWLTIDQYTTLRPAAAKKKAPMAEACEAALRTI